MAHKKRFLGKYLSSSETDDCRSPRHDGRAWYIPKTSVSYVDRAQKQEEKAKPPGKKDFQSAFQNFLKSNTEATSSSGKCNFCNNFWAGCTQF